MDPRQNTLIDIPERALKGKDITNIVTYLLLNRIGVNVMILKVSIV